MDSPGFAQHRGPMPVTAEDMALLAGAALSMSEPETGHGVLTVNVEPSAWLQALVWACDELGCSVLDSLHGALDAHPAGILVVAHLHCPRVRHHLLLRTLVTAERPCLPTATGLFPGACRHEREAHAMFGMVFTRP